MNAGDIENYLKNVCNLPVKWVSMINDIDYNIYYTRPLTDEEELKTENLTFKIKKQKYKDLIASHRWTEETGGVTITLPERESFKVFSDTNTQSKLTGTLIAIQAGAISLVSWKTIDKGFQTLNSIELQSVWGQVLYHIQSCFNREAELLEILENTPENELENLIPVIEKFWP